MANKKGGKKQTKHESNHSKKTSPPISPAPASSSDNEVEEVEEVETISNQPTHSLPSNNRERKAVRSRYKAQPLSYFGALKERYIVSTGLYVLEPNERVLITIILVLILVSTLYGLIRLLASTYNSL
ncbi:hypothetical protein PROFUN_05529 [Planoprotostelium fungivorum]|uniref:Uncharacterized protein n=1 Tax=Planoprotostelium fungivorum TaxID=1890364 RepID=A0A2P6NR85_9EUKA|nr:hypothetical protein PROFUN_05529 [Planoprotostelium fungivorum]